MVCARMGAGNKGVQPLDLVGEPVLGQEIQRAICNWRLGGKSSLSQQIEQRIGADRAMFTQQQFKHLSTNRREPQPLVRAPLFRRGQRSFDARTMVVRSKANG